MKTNIRLKYGTNFISSLISIGLVLFLLGLIGIIIIHASQIAKHVRENITVTVMLKDTVRDADRFALQKSLDANPVVLSTQYVTPEEASKKFISETGENFVEFLGYIPLPASIEVHLKAEFTDENNLEKFQKKIKNEPIVRDVYYEKDLVDVINENIARISIVLLFIAVLMLIITMVLINNTMRLHIYSKRFLIRSMLLVGASHGFIRKPFLIRGFWIGLSGALFSIILMFATIHFIRRQIPDLADVFVIDWFALLLAAILFMGILLSMMFSSFSVRKYVRLDLDNLYK